MRRDIVVIGASAGGLTPLCTLIQGLPTELPAAVFVVLHVGSASALHEVLRRCGRTNVIRAEDGQPIEEGRVYVAPPSVHLALAPDSVRLSHGPRENRHRPSIDVLFRSASQHFGPRVVGVLLSGALDDGAAGLFSIKARGGLALVQEPDNAAVPDMPRAALRLVDVDHCAPVTKLPELLLQAMNAKDPKSKATGEPRSGNGPPKATKHLVPFVCPDCDGPIFEETTEGMTQFACAIGHRFSPESFSEAHRDALERALWIAVRTLENRKQIHSLLGERAKAQGDKAGFNNMEEIAAAAESDMALIKDIISRL
jgi:two-component system, chemotaxis family, protein-glutamate methylesterase/glutaminase